jgi:hypothetical protein
MYNTESVKNLCEEKFKAMGKEDWIPLCKHVKETECEYREHKIIFDDKTDNIIIYLGEWKVAVILKMVMKAVMANCMGSSNCRTVIRSYR